jgi:hypothetical protein
LSFTIPAGAEPPARSAGDAGWLVGIGGSAAAVFIAAPGGGRVAASAKIWRCDEGAAPMLAQPPNPLVRPGRCLDANRV